ncbi:MAG: arsenate-mycothiol transferase ArsC [Nitritalea sp.]
METTPLFPALLAQIEALPVAQVTQERQKILQPLIAFIVDKVQKKAAVHLNFICTHNSRRSHLAQIWAQTLAAFYGLPHVYCYSGGTEATAMFPTVVATLSQQGFQIEPLSEGKNPLYAVKFGKNAPPLLAFSKTYDAPFNPGSSFAAVMTCSQADEGCPFIPGAEKRLPVRYEDPKVFDGTAEQAAKYLERSLQIATEMTYVFSQIASLCALHNK